MYSQNRDAGAVPTLHKPILFFGPGEKIAPGQGASLYIFLGRGWVCRFVNIELNHKITGGQTQKDAFI